MAELYTANVKLNNKLCIVVGGGKVAERKVQSLLECGALVKVIALSFTATLKSMAPQKQLRLINKGFDDTDLEQAFLVISATDNEELNQRISDICHRRNILVNVVDDPQKCSFYVPAVLKRGDLTIAISTNGKSPVLAAKIREGFAKQFGDEYGKYLEILGLVRNKVLSDVEDPIIRKQIFYKLVESDLLELVKKGDDGLIKERINECLS